MDTLPVVGLQRLAHVASTHIKAVKTHVTTFITALFVIAQAEVRGGVWPRSSLLGRGPFDPP